MAIIVRIDIDGIEDVTDICDGLKNPNVIISRAINKGIDKSRTEAWRHVKAAFVIKQNKFYSGVTRKKASASNLSGGTYFSNKKFTYFDFGDARQVKSGVQVRPWSGQKNIITSAFIATMKSGHESVWKRKTRKRLPIEEIKGFSAAQMVDNPPGKGGNILDRCEIAAEEAYEKELMRQIDLAISTGRARAL